MLSKELLLYTRLEKSETKKKNLEIKKKTVRFLSIYVILKKPKIKS